MKIDFNDFCVNELVDELSSIYKSGEKKKKSIKKKKEKKYNIGDNIKLSADKLEQMISKKSDTPSDEGMDIFIDGVMPK